MDTEKIIFQQGNKQIIQQGKHFFSRVFEGNDSFESGDFNTFEKAKESLGILPTTAENNRLIAEFMGWEITKPFESEYAQIPTKLYKPLTVTEIESGTYEFRSDIYDLEFHTNWNWLMEVVEKIESLGYNTKTESLEHTRVTIQNSKLLTLIEIDAETKIQATYNACIEFIKWYNLNNK